MQAPAASLEVLKVGAANILGRQLTETELEQFSKYLELLQKWQKVQRLVGSTDPDWIVDKLFLDSLMFLRVLPPSLSSVCDVGSGAGFPGIPIKIVSPLLRTTLIESRLRRVSFLAQVIRVLELREISVEAVRADDALTRLRSSFDAAVLRCAGSAAAMVPAVSPLVVPGGLIVCSGPPKRRPLPGGGEWKEVCDLTGERRRLFAVFHV